MNNTNSKLIDIEVSQVRSSAAVPHHTGASFPGKFRRGPVRNRRDERPSDKVLRDHKPASGILPFAKPGTKRRTYKVTFPVSESQRKVLVTMYPGYDLVFLSNGVRHSHPCLAMSRYIAEREIVQSYSHLFSRRHPLLDVGLSLRNISDSRIHGCECSTSVRALSRLNNIARELRRRKTKYKFTTSVSKKLPGDRCYTYCTHNAMVCDCVEPGAALFTHSIYYNNPFDVAVILNRTQNKIGFAIYHQFVGDKGVFFEDDTGVEARWVRNNGLITMKVHGNDWNYEHPAVDWLDQPEHKVKIGTEFFILVVTKIQSETTGVVRMCQLELLPFVGTRLTRTQYEVHDELFKVEEIDPEVAHFLPSGIVNTTFSRGLRAIQHVESGNAFPVKMATNLERYMFNKEISPATWLACLTRAQALATPTLYKEMNSSISNQSIVDSLPYVVTYVLMKKLASTERMSHALHPRFAGEVARHNALIKGNYPYWAVRLNMLALLIISIVGITLLIRFTPLRDAIGIFWDLIPTVAVPQLHHVSNYFVTMLFAVVGVSLFAYLGKYAVCSLFHVGYSISNGASPIELDFSVPFAMFVSFLLIFWLLLHLFKRKKRSQKYEIWDIWKRSYLERESILVETPCRNEALKSFNTVINPDDYPMRAKTKFKVIEMLDKSHTDSVRPVGIVFSNAVPFVHSSSQWNYEVAFKTRVLCEVPEPKCGAWEYHAYLVDGLLPLVHGPTGPEPIRTYNPLVFCQCDTWEEPSYHDWLSRFPPQKRVKINDWRKRILEGDWNFKDLYYKAFTKREKLIGIIAGVFIGQRPRVVQGCSMLEKVATGLWFYQYGKAMKFVWHIYNPIWVASGAITDEFNEWFRYHVQRLGGVENCVFIGTDFSKYDVTQGKECKAREHEWYRQLGFVSHIGEDLGRAILKARHKLVVFGCGCRSTYEDCRQSGSNDTTVGNNKTTGEAIAGCYHAHRVFGDSYACAVSGDDNYTIMTRKAWSQIGERNMIGYVSALGFSLKIQSSTNPTVVEFISCRFFPVGTATFNDDDMVSHKRDIIGIDSEVVYAIGKKPGRVLSKMGWMLSKPNRSDNVWLQLFMGSLLSYDATGSHVPFLRVYLDVCLKHCTKYGIIPIIDADIKHRLRGTVKYVVTEATWDCFYEVYGLTIEDENAFRIELERAVKDLPYMLVSPVLQTLYDVDLGLLLSTQ